MTTDIHLTRVHDTVANGYASLKDGQFMIVTNDKYEIMGNIGGAAGAGTRYYYDPNRSESDGATFSYLDKIMGMLECRKTTEQLRISYSGAVYASVTLGSDNSLTIDTIASAAPIILKIAGTEMARLTSDGLGIGCTPWNTIDAQEDQYNESTIRIRNDNNGTIASSSVLAAYGDSSKIIKMVEFSPSYTTDGLCVGNSGCILTSGNSNGLRVFTYDNYPLILGTLNTERMRFVDTGEIGISCTPKAWNMTATVPVQIGIAAALYTSKAGNSLYIGDNYYLHTGGYKYINAGYAEEIKLYNGGITLSVAASGSADGTVTLSPRLIADQTGIVCSKSCTFTPVTVNVTADNTLITTSTRSFIQINSDNTTPTNRTCSIAPGDATGHELFIEVINGGIELDSSVAGHLDLKMYDVTGTEKTALSLVAFQTAHFIDDGTYWVLIATTGVLS